MADNIFLDANVFMYAVGAPHAYKEPCVRILSDLESGVLTAAINTEIIQELLYRYSHIKLADKGLQICRDILRYRLTILPVTEADVRLAIDVFDVHRASGLKVRDAIHAATMRNHSITRLISADKEFDCLDFVTRLDPLAYPSTL
jgi:predicted nucleic acid-binding protein